MENSKKVQGIVAAWIVATIYAFLIFHVGNKFQVSKGYIFGIVAILVILLIVLTVTMLTTDIF